MPANSKFECCRKHSVNGSYQLALLADAILDNREIKHQQEQNCHSSTISDYCSGMIVACLKMVEQTYGSNNCIGDKKNYFNTLSDMRRLNYFDNRLADTASASYAIKEGYQQMLRFIEDSQDGRLKSNVLITSWMIEQWPIIFQNCHTVVFNTTNAHIAGLKIYDGCDAKVIDINGDLVLVRYCKESKENWIHKSWFIPAHNFEYNRIDKCVNRNSRNSYIVAGNYSCTRYKWSRIDGWSKNLVTHITATPSYGEEPRINSALATKKEIWEVVSRQR